MLDAEDAIAEHGAGWSTCSPAAQTIRAAPAYSLQLWEVTGICYLVKWSTESLVPEAFLICIIIDVQQALSRFGIGSFPLHMKLPPRHISRAQSSCDSADRLDRSA